MKTDGDKPDLKLANNKHIFFFFSSPSPLFTCCFALNQAKNWKQVYTEYIKCLIGWFFIISSEIIQR